MAAIILWLICSVSTYDQIQFKPLAGYPDMDTCQVAKESYIKRGFSADSLVCAR